MRTLPQLIRDSLNVPRDAVLVERVGDAWTPTSSAALLERVQNLACAIRDCGLEQGDRVALIASDSVNWIVADFAVLFAGCVVVPVFPTQAPDQVAYILQNSQARLIFTDTPAAAERLNAIGIPLPRTIVFSGSGENSLASFEAHGAQVRAENPSQPQLFEERINPGDMAVLIYTSGTTGEPKGVMLSHNNLTSDVEATFSQAFSTLTTGSRTLSVLPFSHIYEHCVIYGYLFARVQHYISHSVEELLADLKDVHPVIMTSVPRIFERMLAGTTAKAKLHGGLQAKLVPWALAVGRQYMTAKTRKQRPGTALALKYAVSSQAGAQENPPRTRVGELAVFCQRLGTAALRHGDDDAGRGHSNRRRIRSHRMLAGDHREHL